MNLETNLVELYHEIQERRYKPSPCICFIVNQPVKREVFASSFRDRVVHHLYYNYVSPVFERMFIYDSYSCRKGKGTLMGINRLEHHIRSCSQNYMREAYVLKLDVKGYFMSIDRKKLQMVVLQSLEKYWKCFTEEEKSLIIYLTKVITEKNPLEKCRVKGNKSDWNDLPDSKCLSKSPEGVGLPIGDLTSQLFSNVFLYQLDSFVKRTLRFHHYGRYVDDFFFVDEDKKKLLNTIPQVREFLSSLGLTLHPKKIVLQRVDRKISFLEASLHPCYRFVTHRTIATFRRRIAFYEKHLQAGDEEYQTQLLATVYPALNSYLGYFRRYRMEKFLNKCFLDSSLNAFFVFKSVKGKIHGKIARKTTPLPRCLSIRL